MFYKACLVLLPALVYGAHIPIVGFGDVVSVLDYPYQASFEINGEYLCGAVIISESFALTAGTCSVGHKYYHKTVRVNSSALHEGGTVINVKAAYLHPDFNSHNGDYNVAILELAEPLTFGPGIRAVALPEVNEKLPKEAPLIISGLGLNLELRALNASYCEECHHLSNKLTSRMICGYRGGYDSSYRSYRPCFGASGDPVVYDGKVYGLVTLTTACWKNPDVYVNLAHWEIREYIKFITGV